MKGVTHTATGPYDTTCGKSVFKAKLSDRQNCPACKRAKLLPYLEQLQTRWSNGHPTPELRAELDRVTREFDSI